MFVLRVIMFVLHIGIIRILVIYQPLPYKYTDKLLFFNIFVSTSMYKSGNAGKLPAEPKYREIVKNVVSIIVLCLHWPWIHGNLPGSLDTYKYTNI